MIEESLQRLNCPLLSDPKDALIIPRFVKLLILWKQCSLIFQTIPCTISFLFYEVIQTAPHRRCFQIGALDFPTKPKAPFAFVGSNSESTRFRMLDR